MAYINVGSLPGKKIEKKKKWRHANYLDVHIFSMPISIYNNIRYNSQLNSTADLDRGK